MSTYTIHFCQETRKMFILIFLSGAMVYALWPYSTQTMNLMNCYELINFRIREDLWNFVNFLVQFVTLYDSAMIQIYDSGTNMAGIA